MRPPRVVFAGGGTGGHLYPALAVAEDIVKRVAGAEISFVGTRDKIEAHVVPAHGFALDTIWISGFRRSLSLEAVLFPIKLVVAIVQSLALMRRRSPDVVVGTGGFVCGPAVFAAQLRGIPTLVQEQNSYPGITTRFLAQRAREVHLTFERSRRFLKRQDNIHMTGNPVREGLGSMIREDGCRTLGLDPAHPVLLVFGGSQGASSINEAILGAAPLLDRDGIQILWQTGRPDRDKVAGRLKGTAPHAKIMEFIEQMDAAYAACDLAVCRSGATTVAELSRAGVAAVLIPYPFAAADHQTENARELVAAGAAVLVPDRNVREELPRTIAALMRDPGRRQKMAEAARLLARPKATRTIADAVLRLAAERQQ
jgi:UDP-N-acetylglucosamine--N-acetylmuramyl-(pentapeptide) pyrophosphoryl-undecaprenol N-acetylglucosamine transferase